MKTILLSLTLLVAFPVFSQNYRTVSTDSEVYFDTKSIYDWQEIYRMIKPDSITIVSNDTIVHHQYNFEFRQNLIYDSTIQSYNDCYISADTGFLGYKTILKAGGIDVYFNNDNDSIFINTMANLNDTWVFYIDDEGAYFEAKVTEQKIETFLGLTDSVKVITIQAMDSLGNSMFGNSNNVELIISKNYGLIKGFSFFEFPFYSDIQYFNNDYVKIINIEGIQHLAVGINDFTAADVYNFDIGDEFHKIRRFYYNDWGNLPSLIEDNYTKTFINNKSYSTNSDTVFYDVTLHRINYDYTVDLLDTIFWGDTTIFYDISSNHFLNTKSLNYSTQDTLLVILRWSDDSPFYRNRLAKIIEFSSGINDINGCPILTSPESGFGVNFFYKGLGSEGYYDNFLASGYEELVYYKKGTIEVGVPIVFDNLISTEPIQKQSYPLKVFPNPATDLLNFQLEEQIDNAQIRIYSTLGQLIATQNINDTNTQFNVADWQNGMYFYRIFVENEMVKSGQVLINK